MSNKPQILRENLIADILRRLGNAPVVGVLGARQVGKTTLSRQVEAEWPGPVTRFELELPADRDALVQSARSVLGQCEGLVILDEVQRLPELFTLLRPLCDRQDRTTKSMHIAIEDLELDHLWAVYPGTRRYPMTGKITALPVREIDQIEMKAGS